MFFIVFECQFSEKGISSIHISEQETPCKHSVVHPPDLLSLLPFLDLDIQGTVFQKKVWKEICRIPLGKTLSYKELAEKIGHPKAYRAVALACSQNKHPLIIPCHRVIGSNGNLSGYRFGQPLKKKLLELEQQILKNPF